MKHCSVVSRMSSPIALLRLYLAQLWVHLSVIQPSCCQKPKKDTLNRTYLATFFAFTIAVLYGTLGLPFEAGQPLTFASLRRSDYLLWHQFFLKPFWFPIDIVWIVAVPCILTIVLDFTLKDSIAEKYLFTIEWDTKEVKLGGKAISPTECSQLLAMFHRSRVLYHLFGSIIYIGGLLYSYSMLFFVIKVYSATLWSLIFWLLVFPYIIAIFVLFVFVNLTHIIVAGSCIQIRQQFLLEQFARLLRRLLQKRPSRPRLHRIWPRYQTFNHSVLSIGLQLEAFNAFYTNYLTAIFFQCIVIQVMLTYMAFFVSVDMAIVIVLKGFLVILIFEMATLLFGMIQFCALVVKKNGQITRLNRQFAVHCLRHQSAYRLRVGQLLKIELLQWPRLLHLYAFKVFGGSRITSKTFYAMAINISGFFLFVMKRIH